MLPNPFAFRNLFQLSMSYGGVVFLLLCLGPVRELLAEPVTLERLRETAGAVGALVPVGMAVAAVVAGMVRKLLFSCGGVNARSLGGIFLLGSLWHLPLTLLVAHAAAGREAGAWRLPLYFTAAGAVASVVLVLVLRKALPQG